jgi:hypothetical protein
VYGERSARHEGDIAGAVAMVSALSWDDGYPLVLDVVWHGEERGTRKELRAMGFFL